MNDDLFLKRYESLNAGQKEAVDTIEGPVMVIAGPGTGKTTVLTLRIANILRLTDTPPNGILALTFTDSGVRAMRMQLRKIIGSRADDVRIYTYHGFAAAVINEFDDHFPHVARARQITDIETESMIRSILKDKKFSALRPIGDPDIYVGKIIRAISDSKKENHNPENVRAYAKNETERIKNDESSISSRGATKGKLKAEALKLIEKAERTLVFADVYEAYEERKRAEKKIDYDDLIIEVLRAFKSDELLLRLIQEKFLYMLVDEHQDTNDSQNELIRAIADFFDEPNLFIVGDEKQAIYRFQGASVENFLKFQNAWNSMKTIHLRENYRSHQTILDAGFGLIENNYSENEYTYLRIPLISGSGESPRPISVISGGNTPAIEKRLVSDLKDILVREDDETIAVIVRRNKDVERVMTLLEAASIPAVAERGADLFSHPIGSLFFDLISFMSNPAEIESLAKTIIGGLWDLDFHSRTALVKELRGGNYHSISEYMPAIQLLEKDLAMLAPIPYIIALADLSGLSGRAAMNSISSEVWRGIVNLSTVIASQDDIDDPKILMKTLLEYRTSAEKRSIKVNAGNSRARIQVITAHSSKGLEYDYVFIMHASEDAWMPKRKGSSFVLEAEKGDGDEIRDARRLFYVAVTRAKSHVAILSSQTDPSGKELMPLRFIEELPTEYVSLEYIPEHIEPLQIKSSEILLAHEHEKLVEHAKLVLLEKGLSVTALNHFLRCPREFFYKSIMKLPEAPTPSSERGSAMHQAFSRIWMLNEKNEKKITDLIVSEASEYIEKSLLSLHDKEIVIESIKENAPDIATHLVQHFNSDGSISTEKWFETILENVVGTDVIELRLHGKLDAVIVTDDKIAVFDYKTRRAMSIAAIKGETKDSDGDYFRQLVFYRLLIESDQKKKGETIETSLVFVTPDEKGRCSIVTIPVTSEDVARVKSEIKSLIESVWSGEFLKRKCDDGQCEWCALHSIQQ